MISQLLDILANWLLSKVYEASAGRFLSNGIAGCARGILVGPIAAFISTFILFRYRNPGVADQLRPLGFLATLIITDWLLNPL